MENILDEAATSSKDEIVKLIRDDYKNLQRTFNEMGPEFKSTLSSVGDETSRAVKESAQRVSAYAKQTAEQANEHVHTNPWYYIGGAAVAGGLLGYFLARKD